MKHQLVLLDGEFAVARLPPGSAVPSWAIGEGFWSVTSTAAELSIVCPARNVPDGIPCAKGYGCLEVLGPFDLETVGVLSSLSSALAGAGVSILAISTFDTDYLLVRRRDLDSAVNALRSAGHGVVGDSPPAGERPGASSDGSESST